MNHATHCLTTDDRQFLRTLKHQAQDSLATFFDELFGARTRETVGLSIVIEGREYADMYDHAPGVAYFTRDARIQTRAETYSSLDAVKAQAEDWFDELANHAFVMLSKDQEYDGMFSPSRAKLVNREGRAIALFNGRDWFGQHIEPGDWAKTRTEIKQLQSEASFEAGWDNFGTAQSLREKAHLLAMQLEVSEAAMAHEIDHVPF